MSVPTTRDDKAPETAAFRPRRIAHVNLFVRDLHESLAFYRDVCGFVPVFDEPGISAVFLSNGNSHHDIALMEVSHVERTGLDGHVQVERGRGARAGLNHLGFEMETEADLVRAVQAADGRGVAIHRTVDHQISRSAYLWDPDGNYLEFYADASTDWRAVYRRAEGELLSSRWAPDAELASREPHYERDSARTRLPSAAIHPLRTSRAVLVVADLDLSVDFYTQQLGFELLSTSVDAGAVTLTGTLGDPDLLLVEQRGTEPVGFHHFGIEVADHAALTQARTDIELAAHPVLLDIDSPTAEGFVITDPDEMLVEVLVARAPDHAMPDHAPLERHFLI